MALIVTDKGGPLSTALGHRFEELGRPHELAEAHAEDLFERALEHAAIVYLPSASLLEAGLRPRPDPARARAVLRAARAHTVQVVVFVLPAGEGYAAEREVLERAGVPYVIVAVPPLIEEVAEAVAADRPRTLWVPRGGTAAVSTAAEAARDVVRLIDTEEQGATLTVAQQTLDAETLFGRATALVGDTRVRGVGPRTFRLVRPVARWVRRGEPRALGLVDRLYGGSAPLPRAA